MGLDFNQIMQIAQLAVNTGTQVYNSCKASSNDAATSTDGSVFTNGTHLTQEDVANLNARMGTNYTAQQLEGMGFKHNTSSTRNGKYQWNTNTQNSQTSGATAANSSASTSNNAQQITDSVTQLAGLFSKDGGSAFGAVNKQSCASTKGQSVMTGMQNANSSSGLQKAIEKAETTTKELQSNYDQNYQKVNSGIETADKNISAYGDQIEKDNGELKQLSTDIATYTETIGSLGTQITSLDAEIALCTDEKSQAQKKNLEQKRQQLVDQKNDLQGKLDKAKAQESKLNTEVKDLTRKKTESEKNKENLEKTKTELENGKADIPKINSEISKQKKRLEKLQKSEGKEQERLERQEARLERRMDRAHENENGNRESRLQTRLFANQNRQAEIRNTSLNFQPKSTTQNLFSGTTAHNELKETELGPKNNTNPFG